MDEALLYRAIDDPAAAQRVSRRARERIVRKHRPVRVKARRHASKFAPRSETHCRHHPSTVLETLRPANGMDFGMLAFPVMAKKKRRVQSEDTFVEENVPERTPEALEEDAAGSVQSGDLQGLSDIPGADSESVRELLEEGQAFEAGIVSGVEN